ncbi:MAG TPA: hypothetical protein VG737_04090, partial [Cyclobacteriaceae bacterium]|nr:hypothetical protein [Cyclobacteriaceae bacterium]
MVETLKWLYRTGRDARFLKGLYRKFVDRKYRTGQRNAYDIPIIINNFNRLTFPVLLIQFLEKCGYNKIVILDNYSTYPPLLEYYRTCPHEVIRSKRN